MRNIFILILVLNFNLFANEACDFNKKEFHNSLKNYKWRINSYIENHKDIHLNCDILYTYNKVLKNPLFMDDLEKNPQLMQDFSLYIKKYPYTSRYILDKETFLKFNKYDISSRKNIESAIKHSKLSKDSKNILYIFMALQAQYEKIDSKTMYKDLKLLTKKYTLAEIEYVQPQWVLYYEIYHDDISRNNVRDIFKYFIKTVDIIGIDTLRNNAEWGDEIYKYFFPQNYKNIKYTKVITKLLKDSSVEKKYKINFLKQSAPDIELAVINNYRVEDIVSYLQPFMNDKVLMEGFLNEACSKEDNNSADRYIVSNLLGLKIKFKNENPQLVEKFMKSLLHKPYDYQIMLLSYFNYMVSVYNNLETEKNKKVLIDLLEHLTPDRAKNMRAIMVLNEYTSYFNDLINNNWKNNKYRDIFYNVRDDYRPLDGLESSNEEELKKLRNSLSSLIQTPEDELDDMTYTEIGNAAIDTLDYASYATMLIPGVGAAVLGYRALAKASISLSMKQLTKKGISKASQTLVKSVTKGSTRAWKNGKNLYKEYDTYRFRYGDRRTSVVKNLNKSMKNVDNLDFKYSSVKTTVILGGIIYYKFFTKTNQKNLCTE